MATLAERIATLALTTFEKLPPKCLPRTHPNGKREWTPMSAVILCHGKQQNLTCVSLATGTKCLPASALPKCSGQIVHDSHAEVLALRGFNYWLLIEIRAVVQDPAHQSAFIEYSETQFRDQTSDKHAACSTAPFKLRTDVSIHFFTTEAPCGDASMEILMNSMPPGSTEPWTGSDPADLNMNLQGRGHFSLLGCVRRKPARADAEASNSKSCTDKLSIKQFTSVLAFPSDLFIQTTDNAYIRSLVIFADQYNEVGYSRAFGPCGRLASMADSGRFFAVHPLSPSFPCFPFSKTVHAAELPTTLKPKASNLAVLCISKANFGKFEVQELLVNGVKQGYRQWDQRDGKASVVSRWKLWKLALDVVNVFKESYSRCDIGDMQHSPRPASIAIQLKAISQALSEPTYDQASSTPLRNTRRELKNQITAALGNWHSNEGDDLWTWSEAR